MSYRRQLKRDRAALEGARLDLAAAVTAVDAPRRVRADEPIDVAPGEVVEVVTVLEDGTEVPIARARGAAGGGVQLVGAGVQTAPAAPGRALLP